MSVEGRCLYDIASVSRESPSTVAIIYSGVMAGEQGLAGADPEPPIRGVLKLISENFGHALFYETTPT